VYIIAYIFLFIDSLFQEKQWKSSLPTKQVLAYLSSRILETKTINSSKKRGAAT